MGRHPNQRRHAPSQCDCAQFSRVQWVLCGEPISVQHYNIRFIDSLSFFQMPLAAFPKTFGLTELKKGYFPHKFNIPDHQEYTGTVPAIDYYMPEVMSLEGREKFETWYRNSVTTKSTLTSKKNWWPSTANRMRVY